MNNLRKFNWITQYNSAKEGEELVKPSVSLVIDKAVVIYDDDIQYRWINLDPEVDYICDTSTFTKYYKQKKQQSNDGYTWEDVVPAEYRRGDVYQTKSRDCGYMPKLYSTYSDGKEYELLCNSSNMLTMQETRPSGYKFSAMTNSIIGDCVTSIGYNAFQNCSSLTSCTIGSGVTSIGADAFENCTSLTSINLPSGITSIGGGAFLKCSSLTSIDIPSSVTNISTFAFSYCTSLTSCTIGSGVTSIGTSAFSNCSSLTSIDIPNSVTSIGDWTFGTCSSLSSIDIPDSVTSIGQQAFASCSGLTSITVEATTPPTLGILVFYGSTCPIYVPAESVEAYKTASGWSNYASRIQAIH